MATIVPEFPANEPETLGTDIAGMGNFFVDPSGAAKYLFRKWFWLGPFIVVSAISLITYYLTLPMIEHVLEITPAPPNTPPEQYQRGLEIGMMIQRAIVFLMPVIIAVMWAVSALILAGMCSALSVDAKFRSLFNLVAGCSLIQLLGGLAGFLILKLKGEISTMAELHPALGLDIFLPEGTNKYAVALAGYINITEIWWVVMMVLVLSAAFRMSKGKAFAIVSPLIILSLLFRFVGAAFQR